MRFDAPHSKVLQQVGATVAALILLAVFVASTYYKNQTYVNSYEVWGVFHYYLGAKYFPEVGYFNLYNCALEADAAAAGNWDALILVRDTLSYRIVPRSALPPCPRNRFTPERWSAFSRDVEQFSRLAPLDYFALVFVDKGLNPPPSWVAVARPLAQAVPIANRRTADIVFNLDVAAVLISLGMIWRSRGGMAALLTAALAIFYFGNYGCIGGNFLQYFWIPFLVAAAILWAENRTGPAGAMLGVAAGLQLFPLFFGLPILVRGLWEFFRRRQREAWRPYFSFGGALFGVLLASLLIGGMAGRGAGAWGEWQKKISIHKSYLPGEIFNIGLANLTATAFSEDRSDAVQYPDDSLKTFARLDWLSRNIGIYYALCALVLAAWFAIVVRAPAGDLFGHGFLVLYAAVTLSPYYYVSLALVPFFFWRSGRTLRLYAIFGTIALIAAHAVLFRGLYISFRYWPHLWSKGSIALYFAGLATVSLLSYRPSRQASPSPAIYNRPHAI